GSFAEAQHGEVTFPEISTTILEKICQYFHWSLQYARCGLLLPFFITPSCILLFLSKSSLSSLKFVPT
ncbi:unnamed protein product, partial [Linum tenue]